MNFYKHLKNLSVLKVYVLLHNVLFVFEILLKLLELFLCYIFRGDNYASYYF